MNRYRECSYHDATHVRTVVGGGVRYCPIVDRQNDLFTIQIEDRTHVVRYRSEIEAFVGSNCWFRDVIPHPNSLHQYLVPIISDGSLGDIVGHGLTGHVIVLLCKGNMGYRSFAGTDRECLRLPHQIYVKDFEDETGELYIAEVHNITKFRNGVQ